VGIAAKAANANAAASAVILLRNFIVFTSFFCFRPSAMAKVCTCRLAKLWRVSYVFMSFGPFFCSFAQNSA